MVNLENRDYSDQKLIISGNLDFCLRSCNQGASFGGVGSIKFGVFLGFVTLSRRIHLKTFLSGFLHDSKSLLFQKQKK